MQRIKIRGYQLSYKEINPEEKKVILLLHGHPFNHSMWDYQLPALQDFRLIIPDLNGYGETHCNSDKLFIEEQALDMALLLDNLEIDEVHVIGLSMGAQIAIEFSRLFPQRINSLIICCGNPAAETETSFNARISLAQKIEETGMKNYTDENIKDYLCHNTIESNKQVYSHLYQMMIKTPKEGAVASHKGRAERRDNYQYLAKMSHPVLVIAGEFDNFNPVKEMQGIAEQIKDSKLSIIPGAGHLPNMEQPELFNKTICRFYKSLHNATNSERN